MSTITTPATNAELWDRAASLFYEKRYEDSVACYAPGARFQTMYALPGVPPVVEGRDALLQTFLGFGAIVESIGATDLVFHQTEDPDVAIVEFRQHARLVDGSDYENRLVARLRFGDGLIAEHVEYYDPRPLVDALTRLAA